MISKESQVLFREDGSIEIKTKAGMVVSIHSDGKTVDVFHTQKEVFIGEYEANPTVKYVAL